MITTVQQPILQPQKQISDASGTFSWLLNGITLATKMVEAKIRTAGLTDALGAFGATNVQGEQQQKLDVFANQALLHCLGLRDSVGQPARDGDPAAEWIGEVKRPNADLHRFTRVENGRAPQACPIPAWAEAPVCRQAGFKG